MTDHEWAVANLPNYALNLALVRGRVRVYRITQWGVYRSCPCLYHGLNQARRNERSGYVHGRVVITIAKRGKPVKMQQVDRKNVLTMAEWREQCHKDR